MAKTQYFPGLSEAGAQRSFSNEIAQGAGLPYQYLQTGGSIYWYTENQGHTWYSAAIPSYSTPISNNGQFHTNATFTEWLYYKVNANIGVCPFCTGLPCDGGPVQTGIHAIYYWWEANKSRGPEQGGCWTKKVGKPPAEEGVDSGPPGYKKITVWNSKDTSLLQKVQDKINETPAGGIVKSINVLDRTMNTFSPTQMTQTTKVQANVSRRKVVTRSRRI